MWQPPAEIDPAAAAVEAERWRQLVDLDRSIELYTAAARRRWEELKQDESRTFDETLLDFYRLGEEFAHGYAKGMRSASELKKLHEAIKAAADRGPEARLCDEVLRCIKPSISSSTG